jgi:hypothetical protein
MSLIYTGKLEFLVLLSVLMFHASSNMFKHIPLYYWEILQDEYHIYSINILGIPLDNHLMLIKILFYVSSQIALNGYNFAIYCCWPKYKFPGTLFAWFTCWTWNIPLTHRHLYFELNTKIIQLSLDLPFWCFLSTGGELDL